MIARRRFDLLKAAVVAFGAIVSLPSVGNTLIMSEHEEAALASLFDAVSHGGLDEVEVAGSLASFGIMMPSDFCDPVAQDGPRSCHETKCPDGFTIPSVTISCLAEEFGTALRLRAPFPLIRLGDHASENAYQFEVQELKLGALPTLGLFRLFSGGLATDYSGLFGYVRTNDALEAQRTVDAWRSLAAEDQLDRPCLSTFCFTMHRIELTEAPANPALREVLVECVNRGINGRMGAPQYCVPVFLDGETEDYVAAITGLAPVNVHVNRGITSKYVLFADGPQNVAPDMVVDLLRRSFRSAPLSLEVFDDGDDVMGIAKGTSQVLDGLKEWTTVRASMLVWSEESTSPEGDYKTNGIRVGLAVTQFVNLRNTDEWRVPDQSLDEKYEAALVEGILQASRSICPAQVVRRGDIQTIVSCPDGGWNATPP